MQTKIGKIALIEYEPGRWKIDYRDPHNNNERVRLRLTASDYAGAVADAEAHNRYYRGETEIRPDLKREIVQAEKMAINTAAKLSVSDAMKAAESNLGYRDNSLKKYRNDAKHFETYLQEHHGVTQWAEVAPSLVVAYLKQMQGGGLSRNRARLCLLPVRITSEHWYAEQPEHFRDVYQVKRKEIKRLMAPKQWPAKAEAVALTDKQAHDFLNLLYTEFPHLYPMARLTLATGLRVYECAWLRARDVDKKNMTLTPQDTEHHELKTLQSGLPVPVLPWALEAITSWPVDESQPIFCSLKGRPWAVDHLNRSWWRACDMARAAGLVPEGFTAKSLRATFATNLAALGISELYIQRAMRQAPDSVLGESYTKISMAEMQKVWARYGQTKLFVKYKPNKINLEKAG